MNQDSELQAVKNTVEEGAVELRRHDRRRLSVKTFLGTLFINRRREIRREEDQLNSYIDWYGPWPLVATTSIILMSCLDAFFTLILINNGAVEMNVFMDWLIQKDFQTFTTVKIVATSLAIIVLLLHLNFRVYRIFVVRYLMYAMVPMYMALIIYEITLLNLII